MTDPWLGRATNGHAQHMLLILAIVLLCIAIAGGAIVHPLLFALAIVALAVYFSGRRGAAI